MDCRTKSLRHQPLTPRTPLSPRNGTCLQHESKASQSNCTCTDAALVGSTSVFPDGRRGSWGDWGGTCSGRSNPGVGRGGDDSLGSRAGVGAGAPVTPGVSSRGGGDDSGAGAGGGGPVFPYEIVRSCELERLGATYMCGHWP